MNKMKSTQGVMIIVKNDVQRFINDDHNTSTKKIYKKIKIIIVMIVEIILFLTCSFFKIKSIQGLNKIAVK